MSRYPLKFVVVTLLAAAIVFFGNATPASADDYYAAYRAYLNAYQAYLDAYYGFRSRYYVPGYANPGDGANFAVGIRNFTFIPAAFRIRYGQTIVFTNHDREAHTVTADDRSFDSGRIAAGSSWTYTFSRRGTYPFHCSFHPYMRGTLVVE